MLRPIQQNPAFMTNSPALRPPLHTDPVHIVRALALFGLVMGFGLVCSLYLMTWLPAPRRLFEAALLPGRLKYETPIAFLVLMTGAAIVAYTWYRVRPKSRRDWWIIATVTGAVLAAELAYAATHPVGVATLFSVSFWKLRASVAVLVVGTLSAVAFLARRLRPVSARKRVIFVLAVLAILTLDLALVAYLPGLLGAFSRVDATFFGMEGSSGAVRDAVAMSIAALLIPPVMLWLVIRRLRLTSWRWVGGGYLVLAPVLMYLAADDPEVRHRLTMEEISPAFPNAEKSYEVVMRYSASAPLGRAFRAPSGIYERRGTGESLNPAEPAEWQAWLKSHRKEIESGWADLAPVRAWWMELNGFERIADLLDPRAGTEVIGFLPVRSLSQHGCAMASLQALDGHGDEAIDTLLPILEVSRKLQPSARTLVRHMIAIVVERMSLATASFILDHATVSPAARARLAKVLAAPGGGAPGARRLIAVEYAYGLAAIGDKPLGSILHSEWPYALNAISPFVYNRRATLNAYGDWSSEVQELVANRQFDKAEQLPPPLSTHNKPPRFKNLGGTLLLAQIGPAYAKVARSYWGAQDARAALLARVQRSLGT